MTERFVAQNLDLSLLPSPEVIKNIDYEADLAARIASLAARFAQAGIDFDMGALETDPAVILQQEDAYRSMLDKAAINDAARAVLLPFATGANLENLAAFYGVARMVITPADNTASPATPAVMESDPDLRRRTLLAPEALPYAGMTGGGYRSLALKTAPSCKDVTTVKRTGGRVDVILLGRTGNGTVASEIVSAVANVFLDDDATQLTDIVAVRSATIIEFAVALKVLIPLGPDASAVRAAARAAVQAYVVSRHRCGLPIYVNALEAAAKVGGVENAVCLSHSADLVPAPDTAYYCTAVTITSEAI